MVLIVLIEGVLILLCRRWLARSLMILVRILGGSPTAALWIYSLFTLPGILTHEIAHFLIAALLGLRTGTIALLPVLLPDGGVELGSVQVEQKDPVRLALVGLAPLLFGVPLLLWIAASASPDWFIFPHTVLLYFLTTIALHMFPSNRDMQSWPVAALLIAGIFWGLGFLGIRLPEFAPWFVQLQSLFSPLTAGLFIALAAIVITSLVITIAHTIIGRALLYNKSR